MLPRAQDPNSYFQSDESIKAQILKKTLKSKILDHGSPVSVSSKVLNIFIYNQNIFIAESGFILKNLTLNTTFKGHSGPVTSCTVVNDKLVSGSWDKTIRLWDISKGICEKVMVGHDDFVKCLISDGKYLYSSSSDKTIKKWDITLGKCLQNFKGHNRAVESIVLSSDQDNILYSGSSDSTIKMWDTITGQVKFFLG